MADIEHIQYVKAPAAEVYAALATERGLAEIWTNDLKVEARVGAINQFRFDDGKPDRMEVVELAPDRRVSWRCVDSDPEWIGTDIAFDIEEKDGRTSIVLRHTGWREVTEFYRWCNYNWAMFLYSLKQYCEDGSGLPYQRRKF